MPSFAQRIAAVVVFILLLAATGWLLNQLAQCQLIAHLRDQAAHALTLAASGDTPYHWQFESADDIVAGRVFGAGDSQFRDGELVVYSSGTVFEIGLPLIHAVDLRCFPHLYIVISADATGELRAVVRKNLGEPEQLSATTILKSGESSVAIDLAADGWTSSSGTIAPPNSAEMLRLRIALPAGKQLRLRSIVLNRIDGAQRLDLARPPQVIDPGAAVGNGTPILRLPFRQQLPVVNIAAISASADVRVPLLILLPQHGRVEQQIAFGNSVIAALPGAILIPEAAVEATFSQARKEAAVPAATRFLLLRWMAVLAYGLILGYFRWRSPRAPRLRALTEIALVFAAPLWLIMDGRFDGSPDTARKFLVALSLIYAISLSIPGRWRWNGSARAWLLAGAVAAFAGVLGVAAHPSDDALRVLGFGHIARYMAWAVLQQYLICVVCTERWRIVTGNSAIAAYLGALGFALMHTPNAALMLATLCGGLGWCALYLRERALLPLAVSHAASALLLLALLPGDILTSAEVSARFFQ